MAINDISPGFVIITYSLALRIHKMTLPVRPVTPDPLITGNLLENNSGTPVSLGGSVDALIAIIKGFFNTGAEFVSAELWSKPTPADNPLFIESYAIGVVGTSPTATQTDGQAVLTHRTTGGGLHRLYLMESSFVANTRETAPFVSGALNTLSQYMRGNAGWITGRDNARLSAPIAFTTKVNDALRKRRLNL